MTLKSLSQPRDASINCCLFKTEKTEYLLIVLENK
jgi:hypothetical protein